MSLFRGEAYPVPQSGGDSILIIGHGPIAADTAKVISNAGGKSKLLNTQTRAGQLVGLYGLAGRFTAVIDFGGRIRNFGVGGVVLATDTIFSAEPSDLRDMGTVQLDELDAGADRIAIMTGFWGQTTPTSFGRVLERAIELAESGSRIFVFCNQAKVAGPGLEKRYQQARQAGVVITRLNRPPKITIEESSTKLEFDDPILAGRVKLTVDVIACDPMPLVDQEVSAAAEAMGLVFGPDGWPAPDNLLYPPPITSRAGVWAVGGARGADDGSLADDLHLLGSLVADYLSQSDNTAARTAKDRTECATCLTCFRVCPVKAIGWDLGPVVMESVCLQCGQCAAVCPAEVIEPLWDEEVELSHLMESDGHGELLLACGRIPDIELTKVPSEVTRLSISCAGRINDAILLRLVNKGWERIVLASCHHDNCRSLSGSQRAQVMVEQAQMNLAGAGLDVGVLVYTSVAPNQAAKLAGLFGGEGR